jgi:hypothetical protein
VAETDGAARTVNFPPILNGSDYLISVVDLLGRETGDPSPRDLKYAVLHLQAASEVLLKERLRKEHWTLVIKDAGKTNQQKFHSGDFESVTHNEAVRRLADVVGIKITDAEKKALADLAKTRNALQYWGLSDSAPAVEARAARVLDFLISFLDDELRQELDDGQAAGFDKDMLHIRRGLNSIRAYVKSRMDRLRGDLEGMEDRTVACPACGQFALVIGLEHDSAECYFCPRLWDDVEALVDDYTFGILRVYTRPGDPEPDPADECFSCGMEALVLGAYTAAAPERPVNICFNCAEVFDRLDSCTRCTRLFVPEEEELVCSDCWSDIIASE